MWGGDYIESLTLLPGTLAELGATVKLESVSLEREMEDESLPVVSITWVAADGILEILENRGFFLFLQNLSGIEKKVKSILAVTHTWKETRFIYQVERVLKPIDSHMSHFAPKKSSETLLALKNKLEEFRDSDWEILDCLELLLFIHEHLEELQPQSRQDSLQALYNLLWAEDECLRKLARHPLTENVFSQLISIRKSIKDALINGPLMAMESFRGAGDDIHVINLSDLDD